MIMVKYNKSCSILSKWPFRKQILGLGLDDVGAPTRLGCEPAKKTLQKLEVLSYVSSWGARILKCKNHFKKIAQAGFFGSKSESDIRRFYHPYNFKYPPLLHENLFLRQIRTKANKEGNSNWT